MTTLEAHFNSREGSVRFMRNTFERSTAVIAMQIVTERKILVAAFLLGSGQSLEA